MFSFKKDTGHGMDITMMRTKAENERKLRGFNVAKLYFLNKDYVSAERYLKEYLCVRDNSAPAYKLLGEIYDAVGDVNQALTAYKKSFELDETQDDVLLKICKSLLVVPTTSMTVKYWLKRAEKSLGYHLIIVKLQDLLSSLEASESKLNSSFNTSINSDHTNHTFNRSLNNINEPNSSTNYVTAISESILQNASMLNTEKIEDTIKSLFKTQEAYLKKIASQQEILAQTNKSILSTLQANKESISKLHSEMQLLKNSSSEILSSQELLKSTLEERKNSAQMKLDDFNNLSFNLTENEQNSLKCLSQEDKINFSSDYDKALQTQPLSMLFKPATGSWECKSCYVRNQNTDIKCVACEESNPNCEPQPKDVNKDSSKFVSQTGSKGDNFSFNNFGGGFNLPVENAEPNNFTFGFKPEIQPPAETKSSDLNIFKFGVQDSSVTTSNTFQPENFVFGNTSTPEKNAFSPFSKPFSFNLPPVSSTFQFGSVQAYDFQFSGVNDASNLSRTPGSPQKSEEQPQSPELYESPPPADDSFHFKPLIPLPPKVDVPTGEEGLNVIFNERAKLYRFINKEWKERGVGSFKILHDVSSQKVRFLMRRDQVLKVCLNHYLTSDFEISARHENDEPIKCYTWSATDYSEEKAMAEVFAARFKNAEIAGRFKIAVEEAKQLVYNPENCWQTFSTTETHEKASGDLEVLYERKPSSEERKKLAESLMLPSNFLDYDNLPDCIGCRGCHDEIPILKIDKENEVASQEGSTTENSEIESSDFFSAAIAAHGATKSNWTTTTPSSTAPWLVAKPSPIFGGNEEDGDHEGAEGPEPDVHFKPVIPLPELVETKTGEEEEEAVFCQRAKLYRYEQATKEWKERGIGDFKILKHREKNRYRLILRRDQIFKIACNHYLKSSMIFSPMPNSETAICWYAVDYSENVATNEQFAIKFKNKDLLQTFINKVNEVKKLIS